MKGSEAGESGEMALRSKGTLRSPDKGTQLWGYCGARVSGPDRLESGGLLCTPHHRKCTGRKSKHTQEEG